MYIQVYLNDYCQHNLRYYKRCCIKDIIFYFYMIYNMYSSHSQNLLKNILYKNFLK